MGKIQYKLKQYKNASSAYNNFYYPKAVHVGYMTTEDIADRIQKMCTLTKADVLACLSALGDVINEGITNSMAVELDNIGIFKAGIVTDHMVETLKEFTPAECIAGYKVNFQAQRRRGQNKLLIGAATTQYAQYAEGVNDTKKVGSGTSAKRVAIQLGEVTA